MKFIVSTSSLLKQLQTINGVISNKVVIPILEYFLFEIEDGKLTITGTDLEVSMRSSLEVEANENGSIAVPTRFTIDFLKNLPEQPVTFTIDEEKFQIDITSDNGKYSIAGEDPKDFPKFPEVEGASETSMPASVVQEAIAKTIFAITDDDLRPALGGLLVEMRGDAIRFVSTDGNRLVKFERSNVETGKDESFILPKKALNLLKASLPIDDVPVSLSYNNVNALFHIGNLQMVCRLIDEKFPDYEAAIPKEAPNVLTVERHSLISALKRISIFSNKTTYQVRFKISGSELQLSSQDMDYNNEAFEKLPCEYDGEDMEIGFNARFIIEMMNNIESDKININLNEYNKPGILLPEEQAENEDQLMLIMPIVLNYREDN